LSLCLFDACGKEGLLQDAKDLAFKICEF
jgi:hypothetical protein